MANHTEDKDDFLLFAEEGQEEVSRPIMGEPWKALIVDDDESVHAVTRMVLADFEYLNRPLALYSAFSIDEAKALLETHPDMALILLDVVMESEDSGFRLVQYIREQLQNRLTRIILRTGQPGQAPERQVIVNYDINDYKLKSELTADKLFVSVITALRVFSDMDELESNTKSLEKLLDGSIQLMRDRKESEVMEHFLSQAVQILCETNDCIDKINGLCLKMESTALPQVIAGVGEYDKLALSTAFVEKQPQVLAQASEVIQGGESQFMAHEMWLHFKLDDKVFLVYIDAPRPLTVWEKNLIHILMTNVDVSLNNLYLNDEIVFTQKEIIYVLGEVAEARSEDIGYHVKRVAEYSRLLAKLSGLSDYDADMVAIASPVHDIGKMAIPDHILNKPGRLTSEEFDQMKTHTTKGYNMLCGSKRPILKMAAMIALSHHEWWDGSGYPKGLKGDEIHLYGRIVAIADVFDALGSKRVYKDAWRLEDIIHHMKEGRGSHFDPTLIDLMLDHMEEFIRIREDQTMV